MKIPSFFLPRSVRQAGADPRPSDAPRTRTATRSLGERLGLRRREPSIQGNRPPIDTAQPFLLPQGSPVWRKGDRTFYPDALESIAEANEEREPASNETAPTAVRPLGGAALTRQNALRRDTFGTQSALPPDLGWPLRKPSIAAKFVAATASTSGASSTAGDGPASSSDGPLYVPRARRTPVDARIGQPDPRATSATGAARPTDTAARPTRMPEDLWPRFDDPRGAADKPAV